MLNNTCCACTIYVTTCKYYNLYNSSIQLNKITLNLLTLFTLKLYY